MNRTSGLGVSAELFGVGVGSGIASTMGLDCGARLPDCAATDKPTRTQMIAELIARWRKSIELEDITEGLSDLANTWFAFCGWEVDSF
jgi:hypothetical protein